MGDSPAALLIDNAGHVVGVTLDGSTYRLEISSKTKNVAGTFINPATQETLAGVATETKLEAVRVLLNSLDGKDYATQTTLAVLAGKDFATQTTLVTLATESKLEAVRVLLVSIDNKDFATQATLAAADAKLATIDAVLDSIKDTDGVKKITDALPVGDNIIGRTKITDGVDVADVISIDGVLHVAAGKKNAIDANNSSVAQLGNGGTFVGTGTDVSQYASVAISVHSDEDSAVDGMSFEFSQDNTNWDDAYRFNLQADSSQTRRFQFPVTAQYFRVHYTNGTVTTTEFRAQTVLHRENILTSIHRVEDVVKEDRSAQLVKSVIIAQREGAIVQSFHPVRADVSGNLKVTTVGSDIPSDPTAFVLTFLENGGSENMRVDGEITPVIFSNGPSGANEIWSIRELLLTFAADDFEFDGTSFGSLVALTNGFSVEITKNSVETEIFRVRQNEDFLRVPGRTPLVNNTGPKDILGAALSFQGLVLNGQTSDTVQVSIRDDLTSTKLKYLTATLFAVKVI